MIMKWLTTTAVALVIGTGAAIAQSPDTQQKRDEGSRAQSQSKDTERPAAGERSGDRSKGHAEQSDQKSGAKEQQRGETGAGERSKQAQEPSRDAKERQSQEQTRDRPSATQHTQDEQKGRDAKQATEPKQQPGENRAEDKKPGETKQQQGQREDERNRNQQANQPSGTSTQQQSGRETRPDQRQGQQQTGPAREQSAERSDTSRLSINEDQRRTFVDRMRSDRAAVSENVNVRVDVGARLPRSIHARPLPADLVRIAPQYRDYEYTVIDDRVAIVDPRSYEVIDVLDESGGGGGRLAYGSSSGHQRISFSSDERRILKEHARGTVGTTSSISSSGSSGPTCLSFQTVPEELAKKHPELSGYKYLAIGDEAVLVDQQQKIVQVID